LQYYLFQLTIYNNLLFTKGKKMKVLEVLDAELVLVDLEVNLGKNKQNSPTLCARYKGKLIPLSTPDGRPILMKEENALNWP
tara:strand:+ start:75 stop:320 length:246 start_codon:yes stop_codon:yes gene_type:complete